MFCVQLNIGKPFGKGPFWYNISAHERCGDAGHTLKMLTLTAMDVEDDERPEYRIIYIPEKLV